LKDIIAHPSLMTGAHFMADNAMYYDMNIGGQPQI